MSSRKILIFFVVLIILAVGFGVGWNLFKKPQDTKNNNQANEEVFKNFDPMGGIDYEKYKKIGYTEAQIDNLFSQLRTEAKKLAQTPNNYGILVKIGGLTKILHEYETSEAVYLAAIKSQPELGVAYGELADIETYPLGKYSEAVENYKKAIAIMPYKGDYYRWLADLYVSKFPDKKAEIEQLLLDGVKASTDKDNNQSLYSYLATFFRTEGNFDQAILYAKKALELIPDDQKMKDFLEETEALK